MYGTLGPKSIMLLQSLRLYKSIFSKSINNRFIHYGLSLRNEEGDDLRLPEEDHYRNYVRNIFTSGFLASVGHSIAVIQPQLMVGADKHDDVSLKLMIAEVQALVESLPKWRVTDVLTVPVKASSTKYPQLFGSGNLEMLGSRIRQRPENTAVFVNLGALKPSQYIVLHDALRLPIYDRHTLVLEIFRTYAKTKEAKLQVALAELQYLKARLGRTHSWDTDGKVLGTGSINMLGATVFTDAHRMMMQARESALKKGLVKVREHQTMMRTQKRREHMPVVSVVGYTNAGKTSLIRCLTQDKRLVPEDRLFATLAVSVHSGTLPSKLDVLFADTIGFISNIPTSLVAAFTSMLEDVRYSKQIIHIRDMSHPDRVAQKKTVLATLQSLQLPQELFDSMIEIWNKVDLVEDIAKIGEPVTDQIIMTSCVEGRGLKELQVAVDRNLLTHDDMCLARFLVSNGGEEFRFLQSECTVREAKPTEAGDQLIVTTISKRYVVDKFLKRYGNLLYKENKKAAT